MKAPIDVERRLGAFLEDGPERLPDRSFDAVRDSIERTHQRGGLVPWRHDIVNTYAKLGLAAATVVVVAILGVSFLPGVGPGAPDPTPTPVPTQTAAPTPAPTAPLVGVGDIEPGRYAWRWPDGRVSFDVPAGWRASDQGGIDRNRETPAEIGLANWLPGTPTEATQVYDDACGADPTLVTVGPTTADLVAAIEAQVGTTTTVTDVEIGGLPASRIDITVDPAIDPATCRFAPDGPIQVWFQTRSGYLALWTGSDGAYGKAVVWSVDVGDDRVIFTTGSHVDTPPADIAAVDAIVASMAFE